MLMNSEADAIQAVRQGIAEVFVCDETVLTDESLKELGLKVAFKGKDEFACGIAFPKGDTDVLPKFNEFLAMIKADGTLDAITDYWLHGGPPVPYPEAAEIKNDKPIRFSVAVSTAPIGYINDGEWTCMDPDLLKRFGKWAGRKLEINYLAISSAIMGLQTGQVDALGGSIFVTKERLQYVSFSGSIVSFRNGGNEVFGNFQHVGDSLFIQCYSIYGKASDVTMVEDDFGFKPFGNIRVKIDALDSDHLLLSKDAKWWSLKKY